jgi:hypothetical protein
MIAGDKARRGVHGNFSAPREHALEAAGLQQIPPFALSTWNQCKALWHVPGIEEARPMLVFSEAV